jgi:carbonic anhydrase
MTAKQLDPQAALRRLKEGNERFVQNLISLETLKGYVDRSSLVEGQQPFAIIYGCSDSRAPGEIIFNQGLGDLFIIRVAGNVAAPSLIGSVEFAAAKFGTPLVVVMGHSHCGAIKAALDAMLTGALPATTALYDIVDRITPSIEHLVGKGHDAHDPKIIEQGVTSNIRHTVAQLKQSQVLKKMIADNKFLVVGAQYHLETGRVEFLED